MTAHSAPAPPQGLDLDALLARSDGDPARARPELIERLRAELAAGREAARARLEDGAGGSRPPALLSGVTDEVIGAL